ncbi:MAG: hypothetical protein V4513_00685 [Pseudomonadota bacterium]
MIAKQVKIFGERNTGTNALTDMIELNSHSRCLPSVAKELEPQLARKISSRFVSRRRREAIIDQIFSRHGPLESWKHRATYFPDAAVFDGTLVVFTVRHPASWLLSFWKNPYHTFGRVPDTIEGFLQHEWRTAEREGLDRILMRPLELYHAKLRSYLVLSEELSALQIPQSFIRFEDLILRQEEVFRKLSPVLDRPNATFAPLLQSTKDDRKGLDFYIAYYGRELWRKELEGAYSKINENVDWGAVRKFDYLPL